MTAPAAALRSVAEQTEQELGGPANLLVRQRKDHAVLHELLAQVRARAGRRRTRR